MSAYLVEDAHIDALVTAAKSFDTHHRHLSGLRWMTVSAVALRRMTLEEAMRTYREISYTAVRRATEVGQMLLAANVESLWARYPEDGLGSSSAEVESYTFRSRPELTSAEILVAIDGYSYQSCEDAEWPSSEAYQFCEALRSKMIHNLPGYVQATTWHISESTWGAERDSARSIT